MDKKWPPHLRVQKPPRPALSSLLLLHRLPTPQPTSSSPASSPRLPSPSLWSCWAAMLWELRTKWSRLLMCAE